MKTAIRFFVVASLSLAAMRAHANTISVSNSGFESPAVAPNGANGYQLNPTLPSWTYSSTSSQNDYLQRFDSDATFPAAPGVTDGNQYLGLNTSSANSLVYQDTHVHWAANETYTMTLAFGSRPTVNGATGVFGLSTDNTAADIQGTATTVNTALIPSGHWNTYTYQFTTGASVPSGDIFLIVEKLGDSSGSQRLQVDNVQLFVTPEPATWLLSVTAVVGGAAMTRRTRRARS